MRKFGFIFLSLIILAIFFGGFFLYFVPYNRDTQNKYAFLVLQNIQSNLESRVQANIDLFSNNLKQIFEKDSINTSKPDALTNKLNDLHATLLWRSNHEQNQISSNITNAQEGLPNGELYDISFDSIKYQIFKGRDSLRLFSPLRKIIDDILQPHVNDFYQYFLFLKITGRKAIPVYNSVGLSLGTEIDVDSLLAGSRNGFYPGITNVPFGDVSYKMFYIPVNINGRHFAICGFKNAGEYQDSLHEVPTQFVYPIVILLLLLLIILPLIKLYIMGPRERVKIWDFAGYFSALFMGCLFFTIVIIQIVLLKDGLIRNRENLNKISTQINSSFQTELVKAYHQMDTMDSALQDSSFHTIKFRENERMDISKTLISWLKKEPDHENIYYNFDRVSWTDSSGMQVIKGQIDHLAPVFTRVSLRKYFQDFSTGNLLRLPGTDSILFSLGPVYTWIDGSFRIIIAKRSHYPHAYIIQLSLIMYSFSQTILPPGYGYALIGDDGEVQVHADSSHNLNENFFDELDDNRALKGAMKARQELFIPKTKFYGKQHALLCTPVNGLPYYLITFYDTGNVQPVNMRILIFSLYFSVLSFLICLVLWVIFFWRRFSSRPLLFAAIDYLDWIVPRKANVRIYLLGFFFLTIYGVALLAMAFLTNRYAHENNHMVLILLLQVPISITCGLITVAGSQTEYRGRKSVMALMALAAVFIGCWIWCLNMDFNVLIQLILFDLIFFLGLCIFHFFPERIPVWVKTKGHNYMCWYTRLVEVLVVCVSVLPASLYSWYANNQEILQGVKKNQLSLAFSLESRGNGIYGQLEALGDSMVPRQLIDNLKYRKGLYEIQQSDISHSSDAIPISKFDLGYEKFYFTIADQISSDYYTSGYLPALRDHSWDKVWFWDKPSNDSLFFHYALKPEDQANVRKAEMLNIHSAIPPRLLFLNGPLKILLLLLVIAVILYALFILIYRISSGVFLKKYVAYGNGHQATAIPYFLGYNEKYADRESSHEYLQDHLNDIVFDFSPGIDERRLDKQEQWTFACLENWKKYYAFVLDVCSDSEKYLLYNFALNGFINYKNAAEIYRLLDKGILVEKQGEVRLFSLGFRAYILKYYCEEGDRVIQKVLGSRSAWQSFKTPFLILLVAVAAFLFFTQKEAWQRFSALITGLGTCIPLLFRLFQSSTPYNKDSNEKE